jgi:hypothetical protein
MTRIAAAEIPTSRKGREKWGTRSCGGVGEQQVPFDFAQGRLSPGLRPVRNDNGLGLWSANQ